MDDGLRQLLGQGKSAFARGDLANACTCFEKVIEQGQTFADIYNTLGVAYHQLGRFSRAEWAFEEALRINPSYTEAAVNLAVVYGNLGKYSLANEAYAWARQTRRPNDYGLDLHVAGKIANMHASVGDAYVAAGRPELAIIEYRKAVELGPTFVDIRTKLAVALREAGLIADAADELEQALSERPRYAEARNQLGLCLLAAGAREAAIAQWSAVLEHDPENANAAMYKRLVQSTGRAS